MTFNTVALLSLLSLLAPSFASAESLCAKNKVMLQVLGSGGPELTDGRASTSYLLWVNDKARVLIDTGAGSSLNFEKSGAKIEDLLAISFSHFHVDHSADFPSYIKASFFTERDKDLAVYGPAGNHNMPAMSEFLQRVVGSDGSYFYLQNYVNSAQESDYHIQAVDVSVEQHQVMTYPLTEDLSLSSIPVHHGSLPALAWRVDVFDCSITVSGDMNNQYGNLALLAKGTDLLIMHNAIPQTASSVAAWLHMKPAEIGHIAQKAAAKRVVISHRMNRTLGREQETKEFIQKDYLGPIDFADDLDKFYLN